MLELKTGERSRQAAVTGTARGPLVVSVRRRACLLAGSTLAWCLAATCWPASSPDATTATQTRPAKETPPWWEPWRYCADVTTPARAGSYVAGVRADFTRLLKQVSNGAAFAPDSVRVAEILPGGRVGEALSSRFKPGPEFDPARHAAGLVLWRVSPSGFPAWKRTFRVFFDTVDGAPKPPERTGLSEKAPTLLLNGGFELGDGSSLPGDWSLKKRWGCRRVEVRMSKPTYAILLHPGQEGWAASLRTPGHPGVVIDPGQRYRLSFRYAIQRAHPRALLAAALWFDTSRKLLREEPVVSLTQPTSGWRQVSVELRPPRDAAFLAVELSTQCHDGRILVDDIALFPATPPELTTAVEVHGSQPQEGHDKRECNAQADKQPKPSFGS